MRNNTKISLKHHLLPGIGAYGETDDDYISIKIDHEIDAFRIQINPQEDKKEQILDLSSIKLFSKDGHQLSLLELSLALEMSSFHPHCSWSATKGIILSGGNIHSCPERNPSLTMSLAKPTYISRMEIRGRASQYAFRTKGIDVQAYLDGNPVIFPGKNSTILYLEDTLSYLLSLCNDKTQSIAQDIIELKLGLAEAVSINAQICDDILQNRTLLTEAFDWQRVLSLIPSAELYDIYKENCRLYERILAAWVDFRVTRFGGMSTHSLARFSYLLDSSKKIEDILLYVNLNREQNQQIIASKHYICNNRLQQFADDLLSALRVIFDHGLGLNTVSMICYGTLLGIRREGDFLSHDDDVDILYIDFEAKSLDDLAQRKSIVKSVLRKIGFDTDENESGLNFSAKLGNASIDIFPAYIREGQVVALMQNMELRQMPAGIFLPISLAELRSISMPCPGEIEKFLVERYGEDWMTPDPYHEWPWHLVN